MKSGSRLNVRNREDSAWHARKGCTLVEMLMVVALISIVCAGALRGGPVWADVAHDGTADGGDWDSDGTGGDARECDVPSAVRGIAIGLCGIGVGRAVGGVWIAAGGFAETVTGGGGALLVFGRGAACVGVRGGIVGIGAGAAGFFY